MRSEKWKIKSLHSFSRSESEIETDRDREREVKMKKNSREFSRNENLAGVCHHHHHHPHCRGWNADNEKNLIEALASSLNKQEVGGSFSYLPMFWPLHFLFSNFWLFPGHCWYIKALNKSKYLILNQFIVFFYISSTQPWDRIKKDLLQGDFGIINKGIHKGDYCKIKDRYLRHNHPEVCYKEQDHRR